MTDAPAMTDVTLKPCPLCKSDEVSHGYTYAGGLEMGNCECHSCDLVLWKETEAEAIAAWNHRPDSPKGLHPSHETRISDASSFDEICIHCGATDGIGTWGAIADPCKAVSSEPVDALAEAREALTRKIDSVLSIETPAMGGDNLAIVLCSHFDNPDQPQDDETGWSEDATRGYDEVKAAIAAHFAPILSRLNAQGEVK